MAKRKQLLQAPPSTPFKPLPKEGPSTPLDEVLHFLGVATGLEEQGAGDASDAIASLLPAGLLGKIAGVFRKRPKVPSPIGTPIERPNLPEFAPVDAPAAPTLDDLMQMRKDAAYHRVLRQGGKDQGPAVPLNLGDQMLRNHEVGGKNRPVKRKPSKP